MKRDIYTTHSLADPAMTGMTPIQAVNYGTTRIASDLPDLGATPVTFHFRRMTRTQRYFSEAATSEVERYDRAFMATIVKIEGGHFGEAWVPDAVEDVTRAAMSVVELDYLLDEYLSPAEITDVGMVTYLRSLLLPKAEPRYPRPRTSLAAWDALHRPSAEPTRDDARLNSGERNSARV